jgi:hypothetical protein
MADSEAAATLESVFSLICWGLVFWIVIDADSVSTVVLGITLFCAGMFHTAAGELKCEYQEKERLAILRKYKKDR